MTLTRLLFSFQGRINRTKFWLGYLIYYLVTVACYSAAAFFYVMSYRPDHQTFWRSPPRPVAERRRVTDRTAGLSRAPHPEFGNLSTVDAGSAIL